MRRNGQGQGCGRNQGNATHNQGRGLGKALDFRGNEGIDTQHKGRGMNKNTEACHGNGVGFGQGNHRGNGVNRYKNAEK